MKEIVPELNFIDEFELSRSAKIDEIKIEFDTIRMCIYEMKNYGEEYRMIFERIITVALRKLLCEKKPILLDVCPEFKMIPLKGMCAELEDGLFIIRPPLGFSTKKEWISLDEWKDEKVAFFNRCSSNFSGWIAASTYENILKFLKSSVKKQLEEMMQPKNVTIYNRTCAGYEVKDPSDKDRVYQIMEQVGYNDLTAYRFIKHLADKQGAHIDSKLSVLIELLNKPTVTGYSLIQCIALQTIVACKYQIPELREYWPDMPNIVKE